MPPPPLLYDTKQNNNVYRLHRTVHMYKVIEFPIISDLSGCQPSAHHQLLQRVGSVLAFTCCHRSSKPVRMPGPPPATHVAACSATAAASRFALLCFSRAEIAPIEVVLQQQWHSSHSSGE